MEDWLRQIGESSGIYAFMNTPWGWPAVESVHFIGLCLLIGTVGILDLRMLGLFRALSLQSLHRLVPFGVLGWGLNVATGFMFLSSFPDQYVYNPAFQTKMWFMLGAGINMALFYAFGFRGLHAAAPTAIPPADARAFALVSLLCWIGVITCGRLITFFRPPFHWCFWCG